MAIREKAKQPDCLRGVLDGVPAVEGATCLDCKGKGTVFSDMRLMEIPCAAGCGGTGRIGARPAIEGLLVDCPHIPPHQPGSLAFRHWSKCDCKGTGKVLHPLMRQLADAGEDEAIVGMFERRLKSTKEGALLFADVAVTQALSPETLLDAMEVA